MSKIQSDRQEDIQFARQTDKVTERQNDSMADSRAAKEPALVFYRGGSRPAKSRNHAISDWGHKDTPGDTFWLAGIYFLGLVTF